MQRLYLQFYVTILVVLAVFVGAAVLLWRLADDDNRTPQYLDVAAELTGALLPDINAPKQDQQRAIEVLQRKLRFDIALYEPDGDMIAIELPNLSIFLMTKESYESYTKKANREALMPGASAPAVISCVVETKEDVDQALGEVEVYGGSSAGPAAIDAASGGYIGYVADPDGHLWELVCPHQN